MNKKRERKKEGPFLGAEKPGYFLNIYKRTLNFPCLIWKRKKRERKKGEWQETRDERRRAEEK